MKRIIAMLLALIMVMSMAACGAQTTESTEQTEAATQATEAATQAPEATEAATEAATEDSAYPMVFDNYGREVVIEKRPEIVITSGPNCTELFVALGLGDLVVGKSYNDHARAPLPEFQEGYEAIPELTFSAPTFEAIVPTGADFIYGIDWTFGGDMTFEALAEYGITCYENNSAGGLDGLFQEIRDIGKIFGVEDRAEAFIADQEARIAACVKAVEGQEGKRVFFFDSDNGESVMCAGSGNIVTDLIGMVGCVNVVEADSAYTRVSYEEVLNANPDYMVFLDYDTPTAAEKMAAAKADPILSKLDCVKEERFIVVSLEGTFNGPRMAHTMETLMHGMYPECFE